MDKLRQQILGAHSKAGETWLNSLPGLVENLKKQWQLTGLTEYENLSWNYVSSGFQSGRPIALKISFDLASLKREVNALRTFSLGSSVEVIQFDEDQKAVLLEAAYPGVDLMKHEPSDPLLAVSICCEVAEKIGARQRPNDFPFDHIEALFLNLEKDWVIPNEMLLLTRKLKHELIPTLSETYVIHGDLHRGNILSQGDGWRAIDPKGFIGTLYNEVWPFVHEPKIEIPWIAEKLGLNAERLLKWCFLHSILATTWCLEDNVDSKNIFRLSEKLWKLLY